MADFARVRPATRLQRLNNRFGRALLAYRRILVGALKHPVSVSLGTFLLAVVLVVTAFATKEVVLLADEDIFQFDVRVEMPRTVNLDRTMEVLRKIEEHALLLPKQEVTAVVTQGGWTRTRLWPETGKHYGMVTVNLVRTSERDRRGIEILNDLRARLGNITGPVSMEVVPVVHGPPKGMPVAVRISGEKFPKLKLLAENVQSELRKLPGVVTIADDFHLGKHELRIYVNPVKAGLYGLDHQEITSFIRAAYGGIIATNFRNRDEELDVVVRYDTAVRNDLDRLGTIEVGTASGKTIALSEVAQIKEGRSLEEISRRDRKRTITVTADVVEGKATSSSVNRTLQKSLAGLIAANPDTKFAFGGEWEKTAESLQSLFRAFLVAALLIFTILAAQFKSFSLPLVVILAIPLSLIGVVTGFFVSGEPVGLIALIGVVGLAGIAVNDATVLVDFINIRRGQGQELKEAIVDACVIRVRPVLLTSITTVAGLAPLALAWGGTAEALKPMAVAICWGLSFCTILTLVIVPCLYVCISWLSEHAIPGFLRGMINEKE
ncbi:MAG: efflux RND transporter permease subunit, partial [Pseudomonadota bacterium]